MKLEGHYHDGATSKRCSARLEVLKGLHSKIRLTLFADDQPNQIKEFDFKDLRFESRIGNTPREIVIQDNFLFTTDDHTQVDAFIGEIKAGRHSHKLLYKLESNLTLVLASVVVCVAVAYVGVVYALPKAAYHIAFNMPHFAEKKFGSSLSVLDRTMFEPTELSQAEQARIIALTTPFNAQFPDIAPELKFRSGMGANAFALPSGEIVFTDDFVRLAEHDNELLSVYFHELGHLQNKHMLRRALQGAMLSVAVILITGDLENFDAIAVLPTLLADLSYSRDFEREADDFAFIAMQKNQIPVESFANIMQRLEDAHRPDDGDENSDREGFENSSKWLEYLSTHPNTQERIERVKAFSQQQ